MKKNIFTLLSCACVASASQLSASVVFSEDFDNPFGGLSGSSPDVTTGAVWSAPSVLQFNGSGQLETTNGGGAATLAMPSLSGGETIKIEATIRPLNGSTNWMGIGLFNDAAGGSGNGETWFLLNGGFNPSAPNTTGRVQVFADGSQVDSITGVLTSTVTPVDVSLELSLLTGDYDVSVGGGIVSSGNVDYSSNLGALSHVGFAFNSQATSAAANPGQLDSFSVEITSIPEPSTWASILLVVAVCGVAQMRRRNRS